MGRTHRSTTRTAPLGAAVMMIAVRVAAAADPIELRLRASGALTSEVTLDGAADDAHLCALVGASPEARTYLFEFDKAPSAARLDPARPGLVMTVAGLHAGAPADSGIAGSTIQVSIGGRRFFGLGPMDTAFRFEVRFRPDGSGGSFTARHLVEEAGRAAVDLDGSWRCPLPEMAAADTPAPAAPAFPATADAAAVLAAPVTQAKPPDVTPAPQAAAPPAAARKDADVATVVIDGITYVKGREPHTLSAPPDPTAAVVVNGIVYARGREPHSPLSMAPDAGSDTAAGETVVVNGVTYAKGREPRSPLSLPP